MFIHQKPIFSPSLSSPGATCPNKTNKSGGPKDVADARPAPLPPHTKMLSLSDWKEWMGTMSVSSQPQPPVSRSIKQNWFQFLRQILSYLDIWHLDLVVGLNTSLGLNLKQDWSSDTSDTVSPNKHICFPSFHLLFAGCCSGFACFAAVVGWGAVVC